MIYLASSWCLVSVSYASNDGSDELVYPCSIASLHCMNTQSRDSDKFVAHLIGSYAYLRGDFTHM